MAGLPRSIIKKYGVSKKAWEIYRRGGGATRPRRPSRSRSRKRGVRMARRRYSRRNGGGMGGLNGLLSTNNLLGTVGGGMVAGPIGAAAGSYVLGKKGLLGAAVAYFATPYVQSLVGKVTGGSSSSSSTSIW